MPVEVKTHGQKVLLGKHGTPLTFARACISNIGEISILEAQTAAETYKREWLSA